jgi:uracil-DNA glycosylase
MSENLQHYYLQQMGIEPWVLREKSADQTSLAKLSAEVSTCTRCPLSQTRTQTVFARGNPNAKLMIIGEAPGFYEDKQGLPFVGKAGGLLNRMLKSIGFSEDDVYIANVIKCRPPNNRDPMPEEIGQCCDYLAQQIKIVAPKLILAVGRFAGQFLLKGTYPLSKMRGKVHEYQGTAVLVSYHPAYLLRNPKDKKNAYKDLMSVKQFLV